MEHPFKAQFQLNLITQYDLYMAYMPFINDGGLFISTQEKFELGDSIRLSLRLMEDLNEYQLHTKVVWISPKFVQGNLPQGIGVQFIDINAGKIKERIENYLASFHPPDLTNTM